jgi:HlyD family secretion protein
MNAAPAQRTYRSIRRHLFVGAIIFALLVGGVGGWAATTEFASAVIAHGSLVVDSHVKKMQHPTGGVVGEVRVRDGDRVHAGDVLVRLDDTITRSNLGIVSKGLDEFRARRARLEAERDAREEIDFADVVKNRENDRDLKQIVVGETNLFNLRRTARTGKKAQLSQRVDQVEQQIEGYNAQADAKGNEIVLIKRELDGTRFLWEKKLVPITKMTSLEREAARLEGERAQLLSAVAEARGKIIETKLAIIQVDQDLASDVAKELRETDAKIDEYSERKTAAEDQLKRVDIRAPQDGTVFDSSVYTIGGVIGQGETIMQIVPESDHLAVEAKLSPQDIDQVHIGDNAHLRLTAFNQRTTPEAVGRVEQISADTISDKSTGQSYYITRIRIDETSVASLGKLKLVPGMPVEVFIQTGERDVLSYLVKPLKDQLARAFREK